MRDPESIGKFAPELTPEVKGFQVGIVELADDELLGEAATGITRFDSLG
jgi:hypothetical protein